MNRDMLMAGLEFYASPLPSHDPSKVAFIYTEEIGPDHPQNRSGRNRGDKLQHHMAWHDVAAAALVRIEALDKAEWFLNLPEDRRRLQLMDARRDAHQHLSAADKLRSLNEAQAETICRLQKQLDDLKRREVFLDAASGPLVVRAKPPASG